MAQKFRNYCYTLNNYTEEEINILKDLQCKYHIMGYEVGESGTPHIQGFISFTNARSFKTVLKTLKRWHLEPCRGNPEQNIKYCMKDGKFDEFGERPSQGKRTDLNEIKQLVKDGKGMKDICEVATNYQHLRFAEKMMDYVSTKKRPDLKVWWFYGPSGTGKTRCAYDMYPDAWISGKNLEWWQGYDNHDTVIIDDFRKDFCTFHELLRLLDIYPYRVAYKGGFRNLVATTIIITCPFTPEELYSNQGEQLYQLDRRIYQLLFFGDGTGTGTEVGGVILDPPTHDDII